VMGKNHARVLSEFGYLSAIVDANEEKAKETAKKFGVQYSKDFQTIDFDAAVIATPTNTHYHIAKNLIENGKHVLIEKPITLEIDEAQEIIDLAKDMDVILAVGHIERYNPLIDFMKENLDFRKLITIEAKRVSKYPQRIRDVGVVMDLGVHDIDVFRALNGDVAEVFAVGGSINSKFEDHASMLLRFKNGKIGYIDVNWLTPKKVRKLFITFEDYYVEGDYIGQWLDISYGKINVNEYNAFNVGVDLNIRRVMLKKEEPLKREIMDFIDSILNKKRPKVSGEDGLAAIKIAKAAIRSIKEHRIVEVN